MATRPGWTAVGYVTMSRGPYGPRLGTYLKKERKREKEKKKETKKEILMFSGSTPPKKKTNVGVKWPPFPVGQP